MTTLSSTARYFGPLLAGGVALWLVSACDEGPDAGGQTGDLSLDENGDELGAGGNNDTPADTQATAEAGAVLNCDETPEPIVDPDSPTELDFSASDILDFAEGDFSALLAWGSSEQVVLSASGETEVTISVEYSDGELRYLRSTPHEPSGDELGGLEGAPVAEEAGSVSESGAAPASLSTSIGACHDSLELDVTISLRTADGALDETFEATLVATDRHFVRFTQALDLEDLGGDFSATPVAPEGSTAQLIDTHLDVTLSAWGTKGALTALVETRQTAEQAAAQDADLASGISVGFVGEGPVNAIASWPANVRCGDEPATTQIATSADDDVDGVTADDVVTMLNDTTPIELTWEDGSSALLSLEAEALDYMCVLTNELSALSVRVPVQLSVSTDDGRLNGAFTAMVTAATNGGALESLDVYSYQSQISESELDELGFTDASLDGYDSGEFSFYLFYESSDAEPLGSLLLQGLLEPNCESITTVEEDGSVSTSGCPGITLDTLVSASWGSLAEPAPPILDP